MKKTLAETIQSNFPFANESVQCNDRIRHTKNNHQGTVKQKLAVEITQEDTTVMIPQEQPLLQFFTVPIRRLHEIAPPQSGNSRFMKIHNRIKSRIAVSAE